MPYASDINQATTNSGAVAAFRIKALLKSVGWTVVRSSDGTTYNAAGDQITHSGAGAGGMANNNAWFVIQQPGFVNNRQFCFQRGTTNTVWRVKYSGGPGTGFVGGAPAAGVTPSATDEGILAGGGTDAAPTFVDFFALASSGTATYKLNILAGDASEEYGFLWFNYYEPVAGQATDILSCCFLDMVEHPHPDDIDPCVVSFDWSGGGGAMNDILRDTNSGFSWGWLGKGLGGAGFRRLGLNWASTTTVNPTMPAGIGVDVYTGKELLQKLVWMRPPSAIGGAPGGYKGYSRMVRYNGISRANSCFNTLNVDGSKDHILLSGTVAAASNFSAVPWVGVDMQGTLQTTNRDAVLMPIGAAGGTRYAMRATTAVSGVWASWENDTGGDDGRPGSAVGPSTIVTSWSLN